MTTIQAIQTHYNGYKFRSRLEARWAVFFDEMGIQYEYEKEGFELRPTSFDGVESFIKSHGHGITKPSEIAHLRKIGEIVEKNAHKTIYYLPDFYLPDFGLWAETKGELILNDADKMIRLCNQSEIGLLLLQDIGANMTIILPNTEAPMSDKAGDIKIASFRRCVICRHWALRNECRLGANEKECDNCKHSPTVFYYCVNCAKNDKVNLRVKKSMEWEPIGKSDELANAIQAARSARFEHGETPKVPRGKLRNAG